MVSRKRGSGRGKAEGSEKEQEGCRLVILCDRSEQSDALIFLLGLGQGLPTQSQFSWRSLKWCHLQWQSKHHRQ